MSEMPDFQKEKVEWLTDLIRRVIANPENAKRAAEAIALDWYPTININSDRSVSIRISADAQMLGE